MTKQTILLLLFLLLTSAPFQVSAEVGYERAFGYRSFCSWESPEDDKPSTDTGSKPPVKPGSITISKEGTNEVKIRIPNAKPVANTGTQRKRCISRLAMYALPPDDSSGDYLEISVAPGLNPVTELSTADFFIIMEISIIGNGSGIVITPEGSSHTNDDNLHTSESCSLESCEVWYPWYTTVVEESEVKKGSRSEATGDSSTDSDFLVSGVKAEPNSDSKLDGLICEEQPPEQKVIDGQTKEAIVVYCTVVFTLVEVSVSLTSATLEENGNLSDTTTVLLGKVANPAGPEKDNENMVTVHSSTDVKITGTITTDPLHIGQPVDMLAVVALAPTGFDGDKSFYMAEGKQFRLWDGNTATLSALQENVSLETEQTLEIYQGPLNYGWYEVYFGYRLKEGTIVFNKEPLRMEINSKP